MKTAYSVNSKMINDLMEEVFGNDGLVSKGWNAMEKSAQKVPAVNIYKTATAYQIDMLVPGISKDLIQIEVKDNLLSVGYDYKEEINESVQLIKAEFGKSSFERKFKLDEKMDTKGITAQCEDGILTVMIPLKAEKQPVQMKIAIG